MFHHNDSKRDPSLRASFKKLADGTDVNDADFLDAMMELEAFFVFNMHRFDVLKNFMLGTQPIPTSVIIQKCHPTNPAALALCAGRITREKVETGHLPELEAGLEEFSKTEQWELQQGLVTEQELLRQRFMRTTLHWLSVYIGGRAADWTMLGVKKAGSLRRIVALSFGEAAAVAMTKTGCLSTQEVALLVARKNKARRFKATARANDCSTQEKSVAAKKGWNKRKQGAKSGK